MGGANTLCVHPARALERGASDPTRRCRRTFLRVFPGGFYDPKYIDWERGYKWKAHERWKAELGRAEYRALLLRGSFVEIASRALASSHAQTSCSLSKRWRSVMR